jgi:hypothetical protein
MTTDELTALVRELRDELSRARQDSHARAVSDRRTFGFASPHIGVHWIHCPALTCKASREIWNKTRVAVPDAKVYNKFALRNYMRRVAKEGIRGRVAR